MICSRALRAVALVVVAIAVVCSFGCGRTRTNTYAIEITGPTASERVRLLLDGHEIAALPGFTGTATISRDEATPFPIAHPPVTLTAEVFGPDGWTAATARIYQRTPEWVESELAKGATLPLEIHLDLPEPSASLLVYVDNRGGKQAAKIALGQAKRSVAVGEATQLTFLSPTREEGTRLRVDGVEIGRVHVQKTPAYKDEETRKYGPKEAFCWLVDVSGEHVYRRRIINYMRRIDSYGVPYKKDEGTIYKAGRLYEIPYYRIDDFLSSAPASVFSQDAGVSRVELVDVR